MIFAHDQRTTKQYDTKQTTKMTKHIDIIYEEGETTSGRTEGENTSFLRYTFTKMSQKLDRFDDIVLNESKK